MPMQLLVYNYVKGN